jgi:predicted RNase H-like HicB family nuclease
MMDNFEIYREAVVRWLKEQGKQTFVLVGGEFETFAVMWDDPTEAVSLGQDAIQVVYDAIVLEGETVPPTLEQRLEELDVETDLMQEILAFLMGVA